MEVVIRYDLPDENGETRRERNERFGMGELNPEDVPNFDGGYLLEWFAQLNRFRTIGINGPDPIQPRTILDWCALTRTIIRPEEINILLAVDAAYLAEYGKEMQQRRAANKDKNDGRGNIRLRYRHGRSQRGEQGT